MRPHKRICLALDDPIVIQKPPDEIDSNLEDDFLAEDLPLPPFEGEVEHPYEPEETGPAERFQDAVDPAHPLDLDALWELFFELEN